MSERYVVNIHTSTNPMSPRIGQIGIYMRDQDPDSLHPHGIRYVTGGIQWFAEFDGCLRDATEQETALARAEIVAEAERRLGACTPCGKYDPTDTGFWDLVRKELG